MNYIVISTQQSDLIRGKYGNYSAIEPVKLPDGNYIIPERCLSSQDLIEAKAKIDAANGAVQEIKKLAHTEALKGNIASYNGLVQCVNETTEMFSFDLSDDVQFAKSLSIQSAVLVGKEQVSSVDNDADNDIKVLAGNIKNYVVDLTDGIRTTATDSYVDKLIADGNLIISNYER